METIIFLVCVYAQTLICLLFQKSIFLPCCTGELFDEILMIFHESFALLMISEFSPVGKISLRVIFYLVNNDLPRGMKFFGWQKLSSYFAQAGGY